MARPVSARRYLELFDALELDNIEDRRVGVHLLRDYFSTVLTNIASEKLSILSSNFNQDYLDGQWRKVTTKFESIPGQLTEEIQALPYRIIEVRNSVTHVTRYDPRQDIDDIEYIRNKAPEWRKEVEELAESYFHEWDDLSPKEALVDMARENLRNVLATEPGFDGFRQDYDNVHETAADAMNTLEEDVDDQNERIERELVQVVKLSQKLLTHVDSLEQDELKYADYLANDVRDQMLGR